MKRSTFERRLDDGTAWTTGWTPEEVAEDGDDELDFEERVALVAERRSGVCRHELEEVVLRSLPAEDQDAEAERRAGAMNPDWVGDPVPEELRHAAWRGEV